MGQSISTRIDIRIERSRLVRELRREIDELKSENQRLRRRHNRRDVGERDATTASPPEPSEVSIDKVNEFVEKLLADPDTNLGFVPDVIERSAQRTMLLFLLKSIAHTIDTSAVKFMGHEIVMRLQPTVDTPTDDDDKTAYSSYDEEDYNDDK